MIVLFAPATTAAVLAGLAVAYCVGWVVYTRFFHPLARIPGPFWASVTRFWMADQVRRAQADKTQRALHARLGAVVRIAPDEVAIADPAAIKAIYGVGAGFTKTDFYTPWRPAWCRYPDLFSEQDERQHARRRRVTNGLYSMSSIARAEAGIDACTAVLLQQMAAAAAAGRPVDLAAWAQLYAFDVVGQLFFSRMFGFLAAGRDHCGYIRALDQLLPVVTAASVLPPWLRTPFLAAGALLRPGVRRGIAALGDIERAAEACVAERQAAMAAADGSGDAGDAPPDILASLFAAMRDKGAQADFGRTEVKVEVYVALFAGSDTTAAAVSSVLYHLMRHRAAYDRLTQEIDAATAAGRLGVPFVAYREAAALPYLDACLKEGMRLHPSVGLTLPRAVPAGGRTVAGVFFPAGTRVGVNAAVVHRDRGVFGADADEFVPERWFRPGADNMDRHMFQFGGGARTCIGKNISLCEMYKMVPQLLRAFRLEPARPGPWTTHNYWFNKPSHVDAVVTAR